LADKQIRRAGVVVLLGLVLGGIFFGAGCSSSNSNRYPNHFASRSQGTYIIQRGDTLHHIAQRYGVTVSSLIAANDITDVRDLHVGQVLKIPGYTSYAAIDGDSHGADYSSERPTRIFAWPVEHGEISSGFGIRNGTMHDGVDIAAPVGTPVHAAESGSVIYSGRLRGYGNVIILRHDDHYVTVYGHNSSNLVREGDSVARGQVIGSIGESGRTTGANLHFEVRRDNIARNPLAYLPRPDQTAGISFARNSGS
jgi:murein DD-endopeptidase MepM/ murein hydrolase activator NlpD